MAGTFPRDLQYAKFSAYGFLKNLQFAEPFLVLFLLSHGVDYLEIGTLYALRMIAVNLLEVPSGFAADAMGRRRTMLAAFGAYIASFGVFFAGRSFAAFVPAMLLFAVGEAFRTGTHKAMIMSYLASRGLLELKSRYYGRTRSWSQLGSALSALIAAAIVYSYSDYAPVFLFSIVPYALDAVLLASYPRELDRPPDAAAGGEGSSSAPGRGNAGPGNEERGDAGPANDGRGRRAWLRRMREAFSEVGREILRAARHPGTARTVVNASLLGGFYKAAKDFLQPLVLALSLSMPLFGDVAPIRRAALLIGVVYFLVYLSSSFASRFSGAIAERIGPLERALNFELALGLGVTAAAGLAHALGWSASAVVLFLLLFVVQNARRPLSVTFVSNAVSEDVQATALSVESQAQTLTGALFVFAIGLIADAAGGAIGIGLAVVSAAALLAFPLYRA